MKKWKFAGAAALLACAACATNPDVKKSDPLMRSVAPLEPVYELSDLDGASAADLDAILGAPALVRREGDGEFRRYALAECSLIIVLYPDGSGLLKTREIAAAALRAGAEKPELKNCLAAG